MARHAHTETQSADADTLDRLFDADHATRTNALDRRNWRIIADADQQSYLAPIPNPTPADDTTEGATR